MDIFPIWRTVFWESEEDSITFRIMKWGTEEIYRARAARFPDTETLSINLNKPCQNTLDSALFRTSPTGDTVELSNAYAEYSLQVLNPSNGEWSAEYQWAFVNDWSYAAHEGDVYSEPINGHAAAGQMLVYSCLCSSVTEEVCYDDYDIGPHISVSPAELIFNGSGGIEDIAVTSNGIWATLFSDPMFSLSQYEGPSGTTYVAVECGENTEVRTRRATIRFRTSKSGLTADAVVNLIQYGNEELMWLDVTSGDGRVVPEAGGPWRIGYDTNVDRSYYVTSWGATGYTSGGVLTVGVPSGLSGDQHVNFYSESGEKLLDTASSVVVNDAEQPLYFDILTNDNNLFFNYIYGDVPSVSIEYSLDHCETWTTLTVSENSSGQIPVYYGDRVYFKGERGYYGGPDFACQFVGNTEFNIGGNIMSLIHGDRFLEEYGFPSGTSFNFSSLFELTNAVSARKLVLPEGVLAPACYANMFRDCWKLTEAPVLYAETLADGCYQGMFYGCSGLTAAPALPATKMERACYASMFAGCKALASAPTLASTSLAEGCYSNMFAKTPITAAPALPATTLAKDCYYHMFDGCSGLTSAPSLPATTAKHSCYLGMFKGCSSLTTAPSLPATTLEEYCYYAMFEGCYSLTAAPALPAASLPEGCYQRMFYECNSITGYTGTLGSTVSEYSCEEMFRGCSSIETAPVLPAATLAFRCYANMFRGCTSLNYIKCLAASPSGDYTPDWVYNVPSGGTFVKASGASWASGINGVPAGWTVVDA